MTIKVFAVELMLLFGEVFFSFFSQNKTLMNGIGYQIQVKISPNYKIDTIPV